MLWCSIGPRSVIIDTVFRRARSRRWNVCSYYILTGRRIGKYKVDFNKVKPSDGVGLKHITENRLRYLNELMLTLYCDPYDVIKFHTSSFIKDEED